MYLHPTIAAALVEQHRRDLLSQASAGRQARAARQSRPRTPARRPLVVKALGTAVAASAVAATVFMVTPAGPAPATSSPLRWAAEYQGHANWGSVNWTRFAGSSQHGVLAVHFAVHSWGKDNQAVIHHFV